MNILNYNIIMKISQEKQKRLKAVSEILNRKIDSRASLMVKKRRLSKKYGIKLLSNSEILDQYKKNLTTGASLRSLDLMKIYDWTRR